MRVIRTLVLTAVCLLALTGVAYAGNNSNGITGSLDNNQTGNPTGQSIHLTNSYVGGAVPDIGFHSTISTPPFKLNYAKFPQCSRAAVVANADACNKALIGSGTATAYVLACGTHPSLSAAGMPQHFTIKIYNGGPRLISRLQGVELPSIVGTFEVNITKSGANDRFTFDLDDSLLGPAPGVCSPIVDSVFKVDKKTTKVKTGKGKKKKTTTVGLLENGPCPGSKKWSFGYATNYTDGARGSDGKLARATIDSASSTSNVSCRPAKKKGKKKKKK